MHILKTIQGTRVHLGNERVKGRSVGFVPTMGALHQGHLDLMRRAKKENDLLAVSIFVNPIQFNNPEDLEKYPRHPDKDKVLLEGVGCDVLFVPDTREMYPEKETRSYDFGPLERVMEGAHRPGHFNGVAIVVRKLLDIVEPNRAYFGEKDFQQLAIIRKLVELENLGVEIVPCSTVREADGLAMSSRNERLTPDERAAAPFIFRTLQLAKSKAGTMNVEELKKLVSDLFAANSYFELEYFEIADSENLQPASSWNSTKGIRGFVAAHLGKVRLIDNIRFI